jgi:hypothetical protein
VALQLCYELCCHNCWQSHVLTLLLVFELLLLLKSCEQSVAAASTLQYAACQYLSLLLLCVELGVLVLSYYCDCVADGLVEC